jgi:Tol biopolymer transport system component
MWRSRSEPHQVIRLDYELPEGQLFSGSFFMPCLAVSPDGNQVVYSTTNGLYLRSVNELTAKLIAGTEGLTQQPSFSPDGKWIGYFSGADQKLKKISIDGGAPVAL